MKVLAISVRSDIGGGPKHLLDLTTELNDKVEWTIALPTAGDYDREFQQLNCSFIDIPHRKFSLFSFFKLIAFAKKNKIKVIHSHGRGAGMYSRLMKFFGFYIVHTFHGVHVDKSLIGRIKLLIDKILVSLTDQFICVSESEKKNAIKHKIVNESKANIILNGVNVPDDIEITKNVTFTIGTLSRLNYQKGLDILIDFISRLDNEGFDFKCLIAGDGELKEELHAKNKSDKIEFLGSVAPGPFLKSIDLYISFARWEGLPIAVLEAMSYGKACCLSNVEGNKDLISNENGILFDLDDYYDFKSKFLSLYENKNKLKQFGDVARQDVIKNFSVVQMSEKVFELYRIEKIGL